MSRNKIFILLMCLISVFVSSICFAISLPSQIQWGMTHAQVVESLKKNNDFGFYVDHVISDTKLDDGTPIFVEFYKSDNTNAEMCVFFKKPQNKPIIIVWSFEKALPMNTLSLLFVNTLGYPRSSYPDGTAEWYFADTFVYTSFISGKPSIVYEYTN